jgi:hypothetical protein
MPGRNQVPLAPDSATLLVAGWTTAPVISTNYLRRITLPGVIGAGYVWTWYDKPLQIGNGAAISELVLANLVAVAPSLFDWWAIWDD